MRMVRTIAATVLAVGLAACAGGHRSSVVAPVPTSTTSTTAPAATTSSTRAGGTTTTGVAPGRATTTAAGRPTTTTAGPGYGTTYPTPTTLAYNQSQVPACRSSDLHAAAYTDRTAYPAGTDVSMISVVTNRGSQSCAFTPSPSDVTVTDASGTKVFPTNGFGQPGCPNGVLAQQHEDLLAPGQSFVAGRARWDQLHHSCQGPDPGPRYPPGRYQANAVEYAQGGQVPATPAPFTLQ